MKKITKKQLSTYLILATVIFLIIAIVSVSLLLRSDAESSPIVTTKIRASSLTYRRTITIATPTPSPAAEAGVSPTESPTPTTDPDGATFEEEVVGEAAESPTPSVSPDEEAVIPTEEVVDDTSLTETPTPTTIAQLPNSGTVQYTSILFIAASVALFVSFIF